jgi:hypothetical protein
MNPIKEGKKKNFLIHTSQKYGNLSQKKKKSQLKDIKGYFVSFYMECGYSHLNYNLLVSQKKKWSPRE